jgi:Mg2+ and Co2+ transporter CorA
MNFVNSEGESTIPLMNNPHGPLYFWIACIVLGGGFLAYCRFSRQWI